MPLVSVIINCAYGMPFVREAIDSVLGQTHRPLQVIFVDNQSTDGSAEVAHGYERAGQLEYYRTAEWLPLYAARNFGLDRARGDFIAFLDCDDIWEPQMLEVLLAQMRPGVDFAYGGFQYINRDGHFLPRRVIQRNRFSLLNALFVRSFVSLGCAVLRADVMRRMRFNPRYDLLGDFDLWARLGASGFIGKWVPDLLQRTRDHGNNYSYGRQKKWLTEGRYFYRRFLAEHRLRFPLILAFIAKCELSHILRRRRV